MKNHDDEKSALEEAAISNFVDLYNLNREDHLEVIERRERPDYILKSIKDGLVGLEVTHLFYDAAEAKMLFGRSAEEMHGLENSASYIQVLNELLKQKEKKIEKYDAAYPIALLIRNASPIFGMSDFLRNKNAIYKPEKYTHIWFVSKDGNDNEWSLKDLLTV
ncbi:hypothetical protein ACYCSE_01215 [Paenibacillus sp. SEL1]|uniref:hypothetical protein n=1 Tax=Paenibacillus polymyxa TaxID=1406 RepID=UPI002AB35547|nr:hypothetical protein [Paenibacillus polymyxa]MDY7993100.1 hypothetical protein [Paenibacillus polymyxa]MDY8119711.1 hypothetical protein [Paenibacillus polymyxa]